MDFCYFSKTMGWGCYIKCIWKNIALIGSYSTLSSCNIHQYFSGCGSYNHSHHLEAEAKVFYQPFVQQDIEVEEDQSFHENINV